MQFVQMKLHHKELIDVIRGLPEKWWKQPSNEISVLLGLLRKGTIDILENYATQISMSIGRNWIAEQLLKAGENYMKPPQLVNCTVSEERIITINIPLDFKNWIKSYQIRIRTQAAGFDVQFFYPSECGAVRWYGRMAANMTYTMGLGRSGVIVDGETITVKAWNAICSLMMAQGQEAGGDAGILMDMAKDGEI